ncbi:hypothetical protein K4K61_001962 [Colletotrichum sp. SAR11_59]|nr:hypothetical protein K4K61_001962 [Colletotrichum sp. SAR11_59]
MPTKKKKSVAKSSHRAWSYPLRNGRQKDRDNNPECGDDQDLVKLEDFEKHPIKDPGYIRIVIADPAITPQLAAEIAAKLGGLNATAAWPTTVIEARTLLEINMDNFNSIDTIVREPLPNGEFSITNRPLGGPPLAPMV